VTQADRSRLPTVTGTASFRFPPVRKQQLESGLGLWCIEDSSLPLVSLLLVVPAGSGADPAALPGLASLTGDLLDEGSGSRSAIDVYDAFARIGSHLEIEVAADSTLIGLTVLTSHLERGLSLFSDCVVRPSLEEADVDRVRQLRLNRLMQLRDLAPAMADRAFMQRLYDQHPYGHLAIGTDAALRQTTVDDVRRFHADAYVPERATLIAVGDVDADALAGAVRKAFDGWQRSNGASSSGFDAALVEPPVLTGRQLAIVDRPKAAQSELRIGHVAVSRRTPDHAPLLVFNMVLGGQFVSRVNLKLREEKGYTYGVRTVFDFRRGPGPFLLQTSVQTAVTVAAIGDAFAELQDICGSRPVTRDELEMAKAALTRGYARNFETSEQLARALAQLVLHGLADDYYDRFQDRVEDVDEGTLARVAGAHLHPDRMLTLVVGDRQALEGDLSSAGLGAPAVLSPV
jgi:zinc protease